MAMRWLKGLLVFGVLFTLLLSGVVPLSASTLPNVPSTLASSSNNSPAIVPLDETASGTTIELKPGDEIAISLESNHSTLYRWHLTGNTDDTVLEFVSSEFVPPDNSGPGKPGTDIWTFRALKPGSSTLTLQYSAGGNVGRTFNLTARVTPLVPASSHIGLWLMTAALAGLMLVFLWRRIQVKA
jgi:inhibitor of cysteine peptidase